MTALVIRLSTPPRVLRVGTQGPAGAAGATGATGATGAAGANGSALGTGTVAAITSSAGVLTIDCTAAARVRTITLTENITSWSFTNLPSAGSIFDVSIRITQHASAAKTVVSPASSARTAGGAWTQSATVGAIETLGLRIFSDGTVDLFPSGVFA